MRNGNQEERVLNIKVRGPYYGDGGNNFTRNCNIEGYIQQEEGTSQQEIIVQPSDHANVMYEVKSKELDLREKALDLREKKLVLRQKALDLHEEKLDLREKELEKHDVHQNEKMDPNGNQQDNVTNIKVQGQNYGKGHRDVNGDYNIYYTGSQGGSDYYTQPPPHPPPYFYGGNFTYNN